MEIKTISVAVMVDTFLLLLIGIGPKVALVPFLELTSGFDVATKRRVIRKMLTTAAVVALLLILLGGVLAKLLHFSTAALSIAGGIVLLIIAVRMILSNENSSSETAITTADPMRLAVFPLAVPYLLNPAGIVALVTISSESSSIGVLAVEIAVLVSVLVIDVAVFRWANKVSKHLDESRMLITEKVFGFLLAALAVQLVLNGLFEVGAIHAHSVGI